MAYKIGTRVRKVRGVAHGLTGIVIGHEIGDQWGDIRVRMDTAWESLAGLPMPAGEWAVCRSFEWEPILDRHEPCEAEFKATLDELLSREVKSDALVPLPQQSET